MLKRFLGGVNKRTSRFLNMFAMTRWNCLKVRSDFVREEETIMFDTGSTAFMLVSTMLVLLMTPGLAFFYGDCHACKNVVNTMFMSFVVIGIVGIVWIVCGWSFAYGGDGSNPFFGGLIKLVV